MKRLLALCLATVLLGACGSRVRNWDEQRALQPGPVNGATTTPLRTTEATTTRPTDPIQARTSTTRGGPTTGVNSALPHPAPGRYSYVAEFHLPASEDGAAEDDTTTYTEKWSVSVTATALTLVATQTADDPDATDTTLLTYRVTASALELQSSSYEDPDGSYECAFTPPQLQFRLPFTTGAKWASDSTCKYDDGEVDRVTLQSEVTGTADDAVGNRKVTTFVVKWIETTTETFPPDPDAGEDAPQSFSYKNEHVAHVDPETLLVVSETVRDIGEDGDGTTSSRRLRSMNPA